MVGIFYQRNPTFFCNQHLNRLWLVTLITCLIVCETAKYIRKIKGNCYHLIFFLITYLKKSRGKIRLTLISGRNVLIVILPGMQRL